jgi:hypothetical protein
MTEDLITTGTVVAAVAAGLVAGVMLAFSTSVMPALRRRPAAEGVAAMQTVRQPRVPTASRRRSNTHPTSLKNADDQRKRLVIVVVGTGLDPVTFRLSGRTRSDLARSLIGLIDATNRRLGEHLREVAVVVVPAQYPWPVHPHPFRQRGRSRVVPLRCVASGRRLHQQVRCRHDHATVTNDPHRPPLMSVHNRRDGSADPVHKLGITLTSR